MRRIAMGIQRFVVDAAQPFCIPVTHQGDSRVYDLREPLRTITAAHRGEFALVSPFIVRHGHYSTITGAGLREGCGAGTFRGQPLQLPLGTVCATNDKHIVAPIITKHFGGPNGHATPGASIASPLGTVTAKDHHALTAAFLVKYYGTSSTADVQLPLPTVTTHDRFGLVTVRGEQYRIVDIGMRMLQPRELFTAQGCRKDYKINLSHAGRQLTKSDQTRLAGNMVPPQFSAALARVNCLGGVA